MQEQRAALAECHSKVHANQLDLAFQQLGGIMVQAASEAGCRNASGSRAHKGPKGKPYFGPRVPRAQGEIQICPAP